MKIMHCPLNGPRNISEFSYGGELSELCNPAESDTRAWAEHVYFDTNVAGTVTEWWYHNATSYWFLAIRNTVTDEIVRTFPASELYSERVDFADDAGIGNI